MDLIGDLKNEIIISDINIFSLSALELQQWLISNFVQQLYRKKVYIDEVTVTPINNSDYITKLSIVGKNENKEIEIIFGVVKNLIKKTKGWFDAGVTCVGLGSKLMAKHADGSFNYAKIEAKTREALATITAIR